MLKRVLKRYIVLLAAFGSVAAPFIATAPVKAESRNCGDNPVIRCGSYSLGELKADYRANQGGNVDDVFREFHINNESYLNGMVEGRVTNTNEIWVGNKKVADRAVTAGRTNIKRKDGTWSIPMLGGAFYMRNPSDSFGSAASLKAFVKMDGETFKYAVIMSCGNPVNAYPTVPPKPQPKPKPQPQPQPQPEEPQPTPQEPNLEITKDVQVLTSEGWGPTWSDEVEANPGGEVSFRITVRNSGNVDLMNVAIRDSLPSGVTFQANTALDGSPGMRGKTVGDLIGNGVQVGVLPAGESVEVIFRVTIAEDTDACQTPLRNIATADSGVTPEVRDDAEVKVCQSEEQETPPAPTEPEEPEESEEPEGEVQGATTLPATGAAGAVGIFSVTSFLGFAAYKLKEFYSIFLR